MGVQDMDQELLGYEIRGLDDVVPGVYATEAEARAAIPALLEADPENEYSVHECWE